MNLAALFTHTQLVLLTRVYSYLLSRNTDGLAIALLDNVHLLKPGEENKYSVFSCYLQKLVRSTLKRKELNKLYMYAGIVPQYSTENMLYLNFWLSMRRFNVVADFKDVVSLMCYTNHDLDFCAEDTSRGIRFTALDGKKLVEVMPHNKSDKLIDHVWICVDVKLPDNCRSDYQCSMYDLLFNTDELLWRFYELSKHIGRAHKQNVLDRIAEVPI